MPVSRIIETAEAVAAALNAGSFSRAFTATRAYLVERDLKDMTGLYVTVVPKDAEAATAGRSMIQHDIRIDVGVQCKLQTADNAEIDALMALVREIAEHLRATGRFAEAVWVRSENTPVYSQEHLREKRVFTSLLTVTCRAMS